MEKITIYDIIQLYFENTNDIDIVWDKLGDEATILIATLEWLKLQGRDVELVDSKKQAK